MLKCDIKNGDHTSIEMEGKFDEILSDTLNLIKSVHKGMHENSHRMAAAYREFLIRSILDSNSGTWDLSDRYITVCFETMEGEVSGGILQ